MPVPETTRPDADRSLFRGRDVDVSSRRLASSVLTARDRPACFFFSFVFFSPLLSTVSNQFRCSIHLVMWSGSQVSSHQIIRAEVCVWRYHHVWMVTGAHGIERLEPPYPSFRLLCLLGIHLQGDRQVAEKRRRHFQPSDGPDLL